MSITVLKNGFMKYFSTLNKATNYLGQIGFIGGGYLYIMDGIRNTSYSTQNTTKTNVSNTYNILSHGLYGGIIWGVVGKTIPIAVPSFLIYNIATKNKYLDDTTKLI